MIWLYLIMATAKRFLQQLLVRFTHLQISFLVVSSMPPGTKVSTRLYRMGITKYFKEIIKDFEVYGLINNEWEIFEKEIGV